MALPIFSEKLEWNVVDIPLTFKHPITDEQTPTGTRVFVNDTSGEIISAKMTDSYPIFTNKEFVELAEICADQYNLTINHYATHKGGKKVLVAFDRPEKMFEINGFEVANHLILTNHHNGGGGIKVGSNNFLFRCENMFASTDFHTNIYHDSKMDEKIEKLKLSIMGIETIIAEELATISAFANVKIDDKIIEDAKVMLFGDYSGGEEMTTTMENKLLRFEESLDEELGHLGNNLFGLHNAFTHYTTHNWAKKGLQDKRDFPLEGERAKMNKKAFNFCKELLVNA